MCRLIQAVFVIDLFLCSAPVHVCIHIRICTDVNLYNVQVIFRQIALAQKVVVLGLCFVGLGGRSESAPYSGTQA